MPNLPARVFDLFYGESPQAALGPANVDDGEDSVRELVVPEVPLGDEWAWGWVGSAGPGIDPQAWPRSPGSRLPMWHAITLRLPAEYQRRGPGFPGIAYFMGDGEFDEPWEPIGDDDPFAADVELARDHPQLARREDIIGQQFALVWLSEAELATGPTPPPTDSRRPGEHTASTSAWDPPTGDDRWDPSRTRWVYLAERLGDPNAGVAPPRPPCVNCRRPRLFFLEPFRLERGRFRRPAAVLRPSRRVDHCMPWLRAARRLHPLLPGAGHPHVGGRLRKRRDPPRRPGVRRVRDRLTPRSNRLSWGDAACCWACPRRAGHIRRGHRRRRRGLGPGGRSPADGDHAASVDQDRVARWSNGTMGTVPVSCLVKHCLGWLIRQCG